MVIATEQHCDVKGASVGIVRTIINYKCSHLQLGTINRNFFFFVINIIGT